MKDLEALAELLDSKFKIAGFKFGLDGLIGLIPGIGDVATTAISCYIIVRAFIAGAPLSVILRMLLNILVETLVGFIPIIGNIFDFIWRANLKNINLMKDYNVDEKAVKRKSTGLIFLLVAGFVLLLGGLLFLAVKLTYLLIMLLF